MARRSRHHRPPRAAWRTTAGGATGAAGNEFLSHEFWQLHFGGDPKTSWKRMRFSYFTAQVIGVLEPGMQLF